MAEISEYTREQANAQLMSALIMRGLSTSERKSRIAEALEMGADINTTIKTTSNEYGSTPLMWAAQQGNTDLVEHLIQKGADVTIQNDQGRTALYYANQYAEQTLKAARPSSRAYYERKTREHTDKIQHALNIQLLNVVSSSNLRGQERINEVERLLSAGANINTIDSTTGNNAINQKRSTPLMWAAQQGDTALAHFLLERGADVTIQNSEGKTAAHYATQAPGLAKESMEDLVAHAQSEATLAANVDANNRQEIYNHQGDINETNDQYSSTQLMHAAQKGNFDALEALLDRGADTTIQNTLGKTALMYAAQNGDEDGKCLSTLLSRPEIDINARDKNGRTALDYLNANTSLSQEEKNTLTTRFKVLGGRTGAEIDQGHHAFRSAAQQGNTEGLHNLLQTTYKVAGRVVPTYDINSVDGNGNTALTLAAANGHSDVVKMLIDSNANVNLASKSGNTPLHHAAANGHTSIISQLQAGGADINAENKNGQTALHRAAQLGHTETVQALLRAGADVNHPDNSGFTPLMYAAHAGKTETVQALIDANANLNLQNKRGQTALDLVSTENQELGQQLSTAGGKTTQQLENDLNTAITHAQESAVTLQTNPQAVESYFENLTAEVNKPRTETVPILDFSDEVHSNAERELNRRISRVNVHRRRCSINRTNRDLAIATLEGLEQKGQLRSDALGQSNAKIYLNRLILVNQMEGPNSPARKALNCLFTRDGTARTDLSAEDVKSIQDGITHSIQYSHAVRRRGRITLEKASDYTATTEEQAITSTPEATQTGTQDKTPDPTSTQAEAPNPNATLAISGQNITNNGNEVSLVRAPENDR